MGRCHALSILLAEVGSVMMELIIKDGEERLNHVGTPVESLAGLALRFELAWDPLQKQLILTMFVKDESPIMHLEEKQHLAQALMRRLKHGIAVEVKETNSMPTHRHGT